ncbi:hypothetical protein KW786_01915 [Candidatus Parcubacteria bacterium]|nr:hypothetical protein [Candidatus Parcubacteria bacterium]
MKSLFRHYILPIATLSSGIIGVGFLSLPYITLKVGIIPMIFYFIVLTAMVASVNIIFAKITLRTPDFKRWPGFVEHYFGRLPKKIILVTYTAGGMGVMLVYLIIGSQFLSIVFGPIFGGSAFVYLLIYLAGAGVCIYFGVKAISRVDFLALLLVAAIIFLITIKGVSHINLSNITLFGDEGIGALRKNWLLPYGALLFSLWGAGFIPEIEEMVRGNKKSLKKIIVISTFITATFYFLFTVLVLSITGTGTTESALVGLEGPLGPGLVSVALCMGIITTFIAFVAEGLLLKKIFMYDMGQKEFPSWVVVCAGPLALFLLGFNSFVSIISFVGGVMLSIDGILILLMYKKIGGRSIILYPMVLIFILGIAYELVYFIK